MIYIAGCCKVKTYTNECHKDVLENKITYLNLKIEEMEIEKKKLEDMLDIYNIINYKLQNDNIKNGREITILKKSNISELASEVFKINEDVKSKLSDIIFSVNKNCKINPNRLCLTIDSEFTNICATYYVSIIDVKFDITIYMDKSISIICKDTNDNKTIIPFKKVDSIKELSNIILSVFNQPQTY